MRIYTMTDEQFAVVEEALTKAALPLVRSLPVIQSLQQQYQEHHSAPTVDQFTANGSMEPATDTPQ